MSEKARPATPRKLRSRRSVPQALVVALLGPAGAGKSTLIRELAARFRALRPAGRLAIFANAPVLREPSGGPDANAGAGRPDPFFARSLAAEAGCTDISSETLTIAEALERHGGHDLVFIEFAVDQADSERRADLEARLEAAGVVVSVLTPDYDPAAAAASGAGLLDAADLIVLNKCDDPRAAAVKAAMAESLEALGGDRQLFPTVATKGEDLGVEALFEEIADLGGWNAGGEKPCQLRVVD